MLLNVFLSESPTKYVLGTGVTEIKAMKFTAVVLLFLVAALSSGARRGTCSIHHGNEIDRLSLLDFKRSISFDRQGALTSWNDSVQICEWKGVSCRNTKHPRRATGLDLTGQGLSGAISPSLGNLTFLTVLNLSENGFTGTIPPPLGHLHRLQFLNLGNNSLQGTIPIELTNCTNLRAVDLSINQLVGEIPTKIASLPRLGMLALGRNKLTGVIPSLLGNITTLYLLDVAENYLEGGIPDEFGRLSKLNALALGSNNLSGRIPESLFNLSSLQTLALERNYLSMPYLPSSLGTTLPNLQALYLDYNRIGGPIPASLANASQLMQIDLSVNFLTGHVPTTLGLLGELSWLNLEFNQIEANDKQSWMFMDALANCTSLNVLALFDNQLEGVLPSSVGNLSSQLQYLLLGNNRLSGAVPSSIGNLHGLTNLGLDLNNFDGTITEWIRKLENLEKLVLEKNNFVGPIPRSLGNLSRLFHLALSSNKFEGSIPATIGKLQYLQFLDISNNHLNGSIPVGLFDLPAVFSVNISHNYLQGTLPSEIGNAKQLGELYVSSNKIHGEIPQTLGNCESLESIGMDNNFLQGNIPPSLRNLKSLNMLNLSHNNLSGPIPDFLGSLQFLRQLYLSYNNLQGEVPRIGVFANANVISLVGNRDLCGGVMELHLHACPVMPSRKTRPHLLKILIPVVCLTLLLVPIVVMLIFRRKKSERKSLLMGPLFDNHFPQVSYMDLARATDDFSPHNLIGQGAYGYVYKGIISLVNTLVAIKVFNLEIQGAQQSFAAECKALRSIRHRNLVSALTACSSIDPRGNEFKAIVYEFMPKGNLDTFLHSQECHEHAPGHLSLVQRISIAIDIANALDYLHHGMPFPIVHCDLKPRNILLDDDMCAHVGDFGLARVHSDGESVSMVCSTSSIGLRGTIGYAAPEYVTGDHISTSGDVYSFGVLLLEMVTKKRPIDDIFMDGMSIVSFVRVNFPDQIMQIIDEHLQEDDHLKEAGQAACNGRVHECIVSMLEMGLACTRQFSKERPDMREVAKKLQATRVAYLGDSAY